jgi:hypothetical protein
MKTGVIMLLSFLTATQAGAGTLPEAGASPIAATIFSGDIHAAARFVAHDRKIRVLEVRSAEVDNASNYKLCLTVRGDAKRFRTRAVVVRDTNGRFWFSQWFPGGC